jgi:26S proteasome regulatory subunit T5
MATPMSEEDSIFEGEDELSSMTTEELIRGARLLETEIRILKVPQPQISISPF